MSFGVYLAFVGTPWVKASKQIQDLHALQPVLLIQSNPGQFVLKQTFSYACVNDELEFHSLA